MAAPRNQGHAWNAGTWHFFTGLLWKRNWKGSRTLSCLYHYFQKPPYLKLLFLQAAFNIKKNLKKPTRPPFPRTKNKPEEHTSQRSLFDHQSYGKSQQEPAGWERHLLPVLCSVAGKVTFESLPASTLRNSSLEDTQ